MTCDLQTLKATVDFRSLAGETHEVRRNGKVLCPVHDDHTPSCHIYADGFYCFACGAHGDHVAWLRLTRGLSTAAAIKGLERRARECVPMYVPKRAASKARHVRFTPVPAERLEQHRRLAAQLSCVPFSVAGRGFTVSDLQRLGFAAIGNDALFPIPGPEGVVLAIKCRYAEARDAQRYCYITPGHGTPAWCSPEFLQKSKSGVLIIEGELNAMALSLAAPQFAVMGVAGTGGALHLRPLKDRTVYVYTDGDAAGRKAIERWTRQAREAGASEVYVLEPWLMDACDIAGREGREELAKLLAASLGVAKQAVRPKNVNKDGTSQRLGLSKRKRLAKWYR